LNGAGVRITPINHPRRSKKLNWEKILAWSGHTEAGYGTFRSGSALIAFPKSKSSDRMASSGVCVDAQWSFGCVQMQWVYLSQNSRYSFWYHLRACQQHRSRSGSGWS
jgi:hypothetical protein